MKNPFVQYKNILILGHSNIGDVCYDLVVVSLLRRHFPEAKITFLTSSRCRNIVENYRGLDSVVTFDRHTTNKGFKGRSRLVNELTKQKFDLAVVLRSTLMHKFLRIPTCWNINAYKQKDPTAAKRHVVDIYLDFLWNEGLDATEAAFDYSFSAEEELFVDTLFKENGIAPDDRLIAILPMAAWSLKSWPTSRWNELARILKTDLNLKLIDVSKKGDDSLSRFVEKELSPDIISAGESTLNEAMAVINRCGLFIGPDSSLLHLASCLQVETIGLYGPTPTENFYPYFHQENIIVTKEKLDCMPCYPSFKNFPCKDKFPFGTCMENISVEDVIRLIKNKLPVQEKVIKET